MFFLLPPPGSSSFSLWISFEYFYFLLKLQPRMTPIQREQEMMSAPRLSGCNQLWLVAAAAFWEEHIKILLLGVREGETGWGGGNYILTAALLPTLGEVQVSPDWIHSIGAFGTASAAVKTEGASGEETSFCPTFSLKHFSSVLLIFYSVYWNNHLLKFRSYLF